MARKKVVTEEEVRKLVNEIGCKWFRGYAEGICEFIARSPHEPYEETKKEKELCMKLIKEKVPECF